MCRCDFSGNAGCSVGAAAAARGKFVFFKKPSSCAKIKGGIMNRAEFKTNSGDPVCL